MDNYNIPREYKPISAWGYFGYNLLFSIPIVGFICLIIFSLDSSNINRRSYARSFFIIYLLIAIVFLISILFFGGIGLFSSYL
jgi:hypothetical protein